MDESTPSAMPRRGREPAPAARPALRERLGSAGALFAIATLIWGSTWLGIKFQLGRVAPEASVVYRFALAALLLATWCSATGRSLRFAVRQHAFIALQGMLMFGVTYVLIYQAEVHAASGLVAVLFSTIAFMNPVGARLAFGTPMTRRMLAAATLGVGGVALLFLPELLQARRGGSVALGIVYALAGTLLASVGNIVAVRNQRAGIPVLPGIAWGMGYGALAAAIVAAVHGVAWRFDPSPAYLASLLYLALLGSVVAFACYLTLMRRVGPGPAAYVGVATPVVAMALSTLFEGYRWTPLAVTGAALALAGNALALRAPARRPPDPR
jgi:drug/metabolite transporter (DMT)-like permease